MDSRKSALLTVIVVVGGLLVYLVYGPVFAHMAAESKTPPALSAQPFHESFVNEEACLSCHAQGKDLPAFDLVAPKIGHEPRKKCVGCHELPSRS